MNIDLIDDGKFYYQEYFNNIYCLYNPINDSKFFVEISKKYAKNVLELGCGYGRIISLIAEEGIEVKGLETSDSMIEFGRKKYPKLEFIKGDMRDFDLKEKFDLIFLAFNTFFHLSSYEDIKNCFNCIKKHLTPHGKVIISITHISKDFIKNLINVEQTEKVTSVFKSPDNDETIILTRIKKYDWINQKLFLNRKYIFTESQKEVTDKQEVKIYFPKELELLLMSHNFKIENIFGDYDMSEFSNSSPEQIIICSLNNLN